MKLSEIATEVILLADSIRAYWDKELPKRHPDYPFIKPGESSGSPPPEASQLRRLLLGLDDELVYQLILVMYLGRGDFDTRDLDGDLQQMRDTFGKPENAVAQMMDKAPLGDYLADGLEILRNEGIDVDQMIPHPAKP